MKELDSARDQLLSLCTPGGQDALNLEVSHLHNLCATSEHDVRERLSACEALLGKLQDQQAEMNKDLKERAAALQWELRSLDQALCYSEPQDNIAQLQQHWQSLQVNTCLYIFCCNKPRHENRQTSGLDRRWSHTIAALKWSTYHTVILPGLTSDILLTFLSFHA